MTRTGFLGGTIMLSLAAAVLIAQVAADGKRIDRNVPNDLVTWRWLADHGQAVLGWGKLDQRGLFVPVSPHPPWPLYEPQTREVGEKPPGATIDSIDDHGPTPPKQGGPSVGALPAFAVNGVVTEKIASDGVTLRASDPETAREGRRILMEAKVDSKKKSADCPDNSAIKIPTPTVQVGPDFEKLGLYAVAVVLACFAGWIYRSSANLPPRS